MEFTQFVLNIFFKGQAILGNVEVSPTDKIRNSYHLRRNKIPWAIDYVTLVSIRQCSFFADAPGLKGLRGADETTLPGQLAGWLRDAGYSNVQDHTFFGKNQQKAVNKFGGMIHQPMHLGHSTADAAVQQDRMQHAKQSLHSASQALTNGNLVLFFGDGQIADALQNKRSGSVLPRATPTGLGKHHWITIRKIDIIGSAVRIKAFTWGNVYEGAFDIESFLSRYNGYISAEP
jgi:hypothetical protein